MPGRRLNPMQYALEAEFCLGRKRDGLTLRAIAREAGEHFGKSMSYMTVKNRIDRALSERVIEDVDRLRKVEQERMDHYLAKLERGIMMGHPDSIQAAIRISGERRKMLGVDAETKVAVTSTVVHVTSVDAELEELAAELGMNGWAEAIKTPAPAPEPVLDDASHD